MSAEVEQLRAENAYLKEQIEELTSVAAVPALRAALRLTNKQALLLQVLTRRSNMLTTREAVPITVGASFFFATSGGGVQWGAAAAVMVVAALPPLFLGLVMYRRISGSMVAGAVKG